MQPLILQVQVSSLVQCSAVLVTTSYSFVDVFVPFSLVKRPHPGAASDSVQLFSRSACCSTEAAASPLPWASVDGYDGPSLEAPAQPTKVEEFAHSRFFSFAKKWENEPNRWFKLLQVPLVPLYARIDAALKPMAVLSVGRFIVMFLISAAIAPQVPHPIFGTPARQWNQSRFLIGTGSKISRQPMMQELPTTTLE